MGGWPADYEASGVPLARRGARFESALELMDAAWRSGGARPRVLLGGTVPAALARAARPLSDGWVAPLFGLDLLSEGVAAVRRAWEDAGREGRPRIVTARYCSLGPDAEATADAYIRHYYGDEFFEAARADTLTDAKRLSRELERIGLAGCDDLLLFPCCGDLEQIALLTEALES